MNKNLFHNPILLLVAAFVVLSFAGAVCSAVDVTLRARASVVGGLVRLGDVADIAGEDEATIDRLRNLPLMPAPAPGTHTVVTAGGVRELMNASGEDLASLKFSGAIRVTIGDEPSELPTPRRRTFVEPDARDAAEKQANNRPRKQTGFRSPSVPIARRQGSATRSPARPTISRAAAERITKDLEQRLSDFVRQQTGNPLVQVLDAEIEQARLTRLALLSRATSPITIELTASLGLGRQRFRVSFETAEGANNFPVHANVQAARPAVYVTRPVPRGATITRADVEVRPLPIDARVQPNAQPFTRINEVVGKEAGKSLRPDTLLHEGNCLPPLLVRRGSEVTVIAGGGNIRVRVQAKARRDGRLGEIVPVETYNSRERLMARVVGGGELAVLSTARSAYTASLPRNLR